MKKIRRHFDSFCTLFRKRELFIENKPRCKIAKCFKFYNLYLNAFYSLYLNA